MGYIQWCIGLFPLQVCEFSESMFHLGSFWTPPVFSTEPALNSYSWNKPMELYGFLPCWSLLELRRPSGSLGISHWGEVRICKQHPQYLLTAPAHAVLLACCFLVSPFLTTSLSSAILPASWRHPEGPRFLLCFKPLSKEHLEWFIPPPPQDVSLGYEQGWEP